MNVRIAVIIPFFQRTEGIVEKAVRSALAQSCDQLEIIIVDDCSPVPATNELERVMAEYPGSIRIVMMEKNSGQGAARNMGLDCVKTETEYVAFLDSDDEWTQEPESGHQ